MAIARQTNQVLSLFSGAGGCSLGFAQAGMKPSVAADIDPDAAATYTRNLGTDCLTADLSDDAAIEEVINRAGEQPPFMIVGGPPCQGFSTAGPRSAQDPRNRLIFNYLSLVERLSPRWFLFENVEGILTSNGGSDVTRLARELAQLGYAFRLEKVNFAGFGLPQTRKRVIIVGNRIGRDFALPPAFCSYDSGKSKSHRGLPPSPTLLAALSDLPEPSTSERRLSYDPRLQPSSYACSLRSMTGDVAHHFAPVQSEAAKIAPFLKPGQTMKDLPDDLQHDSWRRRANRRVADGTPTERRGGAPAGFKRLSGDLNSLTITSAAPREFIHPLALRECARLQAFPDSFEFTGKAVSVARQIGNAIPPLAAKVLAEAIMAEDGRAGGGMAQARSVQPGLLGFHLTDAGGMSPALAHTAAQLQNLMHHGVALPLFRVAANG